MFDSFMNKGFQPILNAVSRSLTGDDDLMKSFKWIPVMISSGLLCGVFAPFPSILVPVLLGGYLLIAFTETIFYLLTLVVSKMMLPTLRDSQTEQSIGNNHCLTSGHFQITD